VARKRLKSERRPCRACGSEQEFRIRKRPNGHRQADCVGCARRRYLNATSPEHRSWRCMRQRCNNPKDVSYRYYGGKGVTIDPLWADSFDAFEHALGPRPEGTTLHRLDRTRGYVPGNVKWATWEEQHEHRRKPENRTLTLDGEEKPLPAWAAERGLSVEELVRRCDEGWSDFQAIMVPAGEHRDYYKRLKA
jgi:hypothetical protein